MKMLKTERSREDEDDLMIWVSRVSHTASGCTMMMTWAMVVVASVPSMVLPTADPSVS